jgi:hypothetical protein
MHEEQPTDAVAYTVAKCLAYSAKFDPPSPAAVDFIAILKANQTLSDDEIAEVGRRVFAKLANEPIGLDSGILSSHAFPPPHDADSICCTLPFAIAIIGMVS